jgi:protein-tyrosine phosphatase
MKQTILTFAQQPFWTHGFHEGERPDPRTLKIAQKYKVNMEGIIAKPFSRLNHTDFDYVFGLGLEHKQALIRSGWPKEKVHLLLEFIGETGDVADPYYGELHDFEEMYVVLEEVIGRLVRKLI